MLRSCSASRTIELRGTQVLPPPPPQPGPLPTAAAAGSSAGAGVVSASPARLARPAAIGVGAKAGGAAKAADGRRAPADEAEQYVRGQAGPQPSAARMRRMAPRCWSSATFLTVVSSARASEALLPASRGRRCTRQPPIFINATHITQPVGCSRSCIAQGEHARQQHTRLA